MLVLHITKYHLCYRHLKKSHPYITLLFLHKNIYALSFFSVFFLLTSQVGRIQVCSIIPLIDQHYLILRYLLAKGSQSDCSFTSAILSMSGYLEDLPGSANSQIKNYYDTYLICLTHAEAI